MRLWLWLLICLLPTLAAAQVLTGETTWQGHVDIDQPVRVERGATLRILPGTVVTFHGTGLEVAGTLQAKQAQLTGSDWPGLVLKGCDARTRLDGVTVSGARTGIQVVGGEPVFNDCQLLGNDVGIELRQKSAATVSGCRFDSNRKVGLFLKDGTTATVTGNRFTGHGRYAVYIYRATPAQFADNELQRNATALMVAYAGSDPQLRGNRIVGNTTGIRVERAARPHIVGNEIGDNDTGIDLFRRADPQIEGNRIEANRRGVAIAYSSYPQLVGNDFIGNDRAIYLEYQSASWERQRGQQARDAESSTRSAFAGQNATPGDAPPPARLDGRIDATGNYWGEATAKELASAAADANLSFIDDGHDRPTFDEGGATWPLDTVIFVPFSRSPLTAQGIRP